MQEEVSTPQLPSMILISWNVRGALNDAVRHMYEQLKREHKVEIIFLYERNIGEES